jgi:hypothetical protein
MGHSDMATSLTYLRGLEVNELDVAVLPELWLLEAQYSAPNNLQWIERFPAKQVCRAFWK